MGNGAEERSTEMGMRVEVEWEWKQEQDGIMKRHLVSPAPSAF